MGKYRLDYFSKYYFYEEDKFSQEVEDGEFILEQIKKSNRFDYKGHSYKYTKFGNISKSNTQRDVEVEIQKDNIDVIINGENAHLDLIYKFETKETAEELKVDFSKTAKVSPRLLVVIHAIIKIITEIDNFGTLQEKRKEEV